MKRSSIPGSIVFLLAGMVGLGVLHLRSTPKVHAQNGCSAATLQGTYIFMNKADAPGYAHQPGQPTAVAGVRTFDGVGSLFQLATVSIGGTIVRRDSLKGTYTLDADCTGTMIIDGRRHSDLFVTNDGNEGFAVSTDDGSIQLAILKRGSDYRNQNAR